MSDVWSAAVIYSASCTICGTCGTCAVWATCATCANLYYNLQLCLGNIICNLLLACMCAQTANVYKWAILVTLAIILSSSFILLCSGDGLRLSRMCDIAWKFFDNIFDILSEPIIDTDYIDILKSHAPIIFRYGYNLPIIFVMGREIPLK